VEVSIFNLSDVMHRKVSIYKTTIIDTTAKSKFEKDKSLKYIFIRRKRLNNTKIYSSNICDAEKALESVMKRREYMPFLKTNFM
jgi:hypothetical protein